jgi:hypothetical protein
MKTLIATLMTLGVAAILCIVYIKVIHERTGLGETAISLILVLGAFLGLCAVSLNLINRGKRKIVQIAWLALASTTGTYVVFDLFAGFFLLSRSTPLLVRDRYVHHRYVPNTVTQIAIRDVDYGVHINALGMRGPDVEPKRSDEYRILMLGDSFTEGSGLQEDETYPVLVEKYLDVGTNRNVRVINGGIDSYAPVLSLLQLTRNYQDLEPDLVVLNLDMSDLLQEVEYRKKAIYEPGGEILAVDGRPPVSQRIKNFVYAHMYFTTRVLLTVEDALTPGDLEGEAIATRPNQNLLRHTLENDTEDRHLQWAAVFDSIRRIHGFCLERNVGFILTTYPWGHQVSDREWIRGRSSFVPEGAGVSDRSVALLEEFASINGIAFINAFAAFRATPDFPLYFEWDMHWTPAGARLMAKVVSDYIMRSLLSGPSAFGDDFLPDRPSFETTALPRS